MKTRVITVLFVTSFLLLSHVSYGANPKQKLVKKTKVLEKVPEQSMLEVIGNEHNDKSTTYLNYVTASYQKLKAGSEQNSNFYLQEALKNYQQVLVNDTSIYPLEGMIRLLFDCGHYEKVVELYEKRQQEFDRAFGKNSEMQLMLGQSLMMMNKDHQAEAIFSRLIQQNPADAQIAYYMALAYINHFMQHLSKNRHGAKAKYNRAQSFLDACVAKKALKSKHFLFYFLKSKLALAYNDKNKALMYIEKSLALTSNFDQGILFKAVLLEQLGKVTEAIKGYQDYLNLTGKDDAVEKQLVRLLFSQKRFDEAVQYQQQEADSPDEYFKLALIERKAERFDNALAHINKALEKDPNLVRGRLLKVDILLASKKNTEVIAYMETWLAENPNDYTAIHTLLLLKHAGISRQDIIKTLETVANKHHNVKLFAALADLHVEDKKYKTGLVWYKKIVALAKNDPALMSKTLFYIAYLFYLAKNINKVETILKQAIAHEPVYPAAYNLLAYHYAQANTNLEEALKLVEKALTNQQDCSYYLDTKGVILLKLGKREEAVKTLEIAHSLALDDTVIQEHLALAKGDPEEVKREVQ